MRNREYRRKRGIIRKENKNKMKTGKTLMEALLKAGYPPEQMFNYCSDLYIYRTPLTKRVVDKWFEENELNKSLFVTIFTDQITGRPMYDVAFQYNPYWKEVARNNA